MKEIWKPIPNYENIYEASNFGRIRSVNRIDTNGRKRIGKILKPKIERTGYLRVALFNGGKRKEYKVHRLVMLAFVGECPYGLQVNHKDENKRNNMLANLEYVTPKENTNYGTAQERCHASTKKPVLCVNTGTFYNSIREASRNTCVDNGDISRVCRGIQKTAGGYKWEFVEE